MSRGRSQIEVARFLPFRPQMSLDPMVDQPFQTVQRLHRSLSEKDLAVVDLAQVVLGNPEPPFQVIQWTEGGQAQRDDAGGHQVGLRPARDAVGVEGVLEVGYAVASRFDGRAEGPAVQRRQEEALLDQAGGP